MKTIILILLASVAALMAITGLMEPAVTISEAALSPRPSVAGPRREWKDIAGGHAILAPRFTPAGPAAPAIVLASLPDGAHQKIEAALPALPPSPAEARSHPFASDIPVPSGLLMLPLSTALVSVSGTPASSVAKPDVREAKAGPETKVAALPPKIAPGEPTKTAPGEPTKTAPGETAKLPLEEPAKIAPASQAARWSPPLVERVLTASERAEDLSAGLQNAIFRMEPIFDPTRIDGAVDAVPLRVSAGTASMSNVFGERWHLASDDANIDLKVPSIGLAWRDPAGRSCDAYVERRSQDVGHLELVALSPTPCARVMARLAKGVDDAAPVPVLVAPVGVPAFAAPMPGSRMSSQQFWAAQKARVEAIEARLREKRFALQPHAMAVNGGP